jgi:hypothetical protein
MAERLNTQILKDILLSKSIETIGKARSAQLHIFEKVTLIKKLIEQALPMEQHFDEAKQLVESAKNYSSLLTDLAAAIEQNMQELTTDLEVLTKQDGLESCPRTKAQSILSKIRSLTQTTKQTEKSVLVSFSRYEHNFKKHKIIYAYFVKQT